MNRDIVITIYNRLQNAGIEVWIDGGWGVDALIGFQTREHEDLDIAVHRKDNPALRKLLESDGFREEHREDSREYMYVMKNADGVWVDIHVFEYDENGNNIYGIAYPYGSLTGTGLIDGQAVQCIDAEYQFIFKTGYEPKEKDIFDVRALCEKYGFDLPDRYKREAER